MGRLTMLKPTVAEVRHHAGDAPAAMLGSTRASSTARGYDRRWRNYRSRWLTDHPLCGDRLDGSSSEHSICAKEGRTTVATDVDHIRRVTGRDDPLFWEPANHQSLCHACHSVKTQAEQTGGGSIFTSRERA